MLITTTATGLLNVGGRQSSQIDGLAWGASASIAGMALEPDGVGSGDWGGLGGMAKGAMVSKLVLEIA